MTAGIDNLKLEKKSFPLFHSDLLSGVLAARADLGVILLKAFQQPPLPGSHFCAKLVQIVGTLVDHVRQRINGPFQLGGGIVEGVFTFARQFVTPGVEAGQHAAFTRRDILAVGLDFGLAAVCDRLHQGLLSPG